MDKTLGELPLIAQYSRTKRLAVNCLEQGDVKYAVKLMQEANKIKQEMLEKANQRLQAVLNMMQVG